MADVDLTAELDGIADDIEATASVYNLDGAGKNSYPVSAAMIRYARPLLAALRAVLALHVKQEKPVRVYDLDLRCGKHAGLGSIGSFEEVRECPDCHYSLRYVCSHCSCPHDEWPCPTVQAITREITGEKE